MTKRIAVTAGPYAGQNLDVDDDIADGAIADGWATDPFAPNDPDAPPVEIDREKALEAAEKAARKLRGEEEADAPKEKPKAKADPVPEVSDPDKSYSSYETRSTKPKK